MRLSEGGGVVFFNSSPVDGIPPALEIIRTAVLVVQVVGMFPDIAAQKRRAGAFCDAGHERIVLIRRRADAKGFIGFQAKPSPTTTKTTESSRFKFGFEVVEAAKSTCDGVRERAGGLTACRRGHEIPEKGVVPVSTAIITNGTTDRFGKCRDVADEFLDGFRSQLRSAFEGFVQIRNIGGVVLAVMDFHGAGIDVGLERGGGVGK